MRPVTDFTPPMTPAEHTSAADIVAVCERDLGLRTRTVVELSPGANGNNEYVFERPA